MTAVPPENPSPGSVLRTTSAVCPECLSQVPGRVVERDLGIWLDRTCAACGEATTLLSRDPAYYRDVDRYYFEVMLRSFPQKDHLVRLTERCNLDCPICLAKANTEDTPDLDFEAFRAWLGDRRGLNVDLVSSEPTVRADLTRFVRHVRQTGNVATIHTNGLKLASREYVRQLVEAGIENVVLQFDGFDDRATEVLRGQKNLVKAKLKALDNLRAFGVSTRINVVVGRGLNEDQIGPVLDYACQPGNEFVNAVFFLGVRLLGSAAVMDDADDRLVGPDEMIDLVCGRTGGRITRDGVRAFQKLYFSWLSAFEVRKCMYVQYYLLLRDGKGGYAPFEDLVDVRGLDAAFERFARLRPSSRRLALATLAGAVARRSLNAEAARAAWDAVRLHRLLQTRFNPARIPSRFLLVSFPTACDPLNYDSAVAGNCSIGELSVDLGPTDAVAEANIARERLFRDSGRSPGSLPAAAGPRGLAG